MSQSASSTDTSTHGPLSFVEKTGYGLGDMASNLYLGVVNVFLFVVIGDS